MCPVDSRGARATACSLGLIRLWMPVDLVGDVVHPRPALGQEAADRRVVARGRKQLDAAGADAQTCRLDALVGDNLAVLELGAEEPLVRRERLVEVFDRDAEVVDPAR